MERVGIREIRQHLSRYTSRVRAGEAFVITDRGEEVAQLLPAPDRMSAVDRLVADRGAQRARGDLLGLLEELPRSEVGGPSTASVLDELREERLP